MEEKNTPYTGCFEDLDAWREARALVRLVYQTTRLKGIKDDDRLCDQLRGAGLSVMNNIAEGWESLTLAEKRQMYGYARRSCGEVRSMLYVVEDNYAVHEELLNQGWELCRHVGRLVTGLIQSVERRSKKPKAKVPRPS